MEESADLDTAFYWINESLTDQRCTESNNEKNVCNYAGKTD